jgi:hypothetical protein
MPKQSYPIEQGGMERVTVSWKIFWKNFTVEFDGKEIGTIPNQNELLKGQTFELPDGSNLEVKLARTWASVDLQLLRNGKPLPGSGADPRRRLKQSYGVLYFIGGLNLVLGLIAWLFQIDFLLEIGMGLYSIIVGSIYLLLAFFVQRRSKIALILALAIYGLETVLGAMNGFDTGVFIRILFMVVMWQGFGAIKDLGAESENVIQPVG